MCLLDAIYRRAGRIDIANNAGTGDRNRKIASRANRTPLPVHTVTRARSPHRVSFEPDGTNLLSGQVNDGKIDDGRPRIFDRYCPLRSIRRIHHHIDFPQ